MNLEEEMEFWALAASVEPDLRTEGRGRLVYRVPIVQEPGDSDFPPLELDILEAISDDTTAERLNVAQRLYMTVWMAAVIVNGMLPDTQTDRD